MCIEEELEELRESVADLESRKASANDWRRVEARAFLALLGGQLQLSSLQRTMIEQVHAKSRDCTWRRTHLEVGRLVDKLNEIKSLRTCAQRRVAALEGEGEPEGPSIVERLLGLGA